MHIRPAPCLALAVALVAACSSNDQPAPDTAASAIERQSAPAPAPPPPVPGADLSRRTVTDEADFTAASGAAAPPTTADGRTRMLAGQRGPTASSGLPMPPRAGVDTLAAAMIIRTGQVTVQVDSLDASVARVRQLAAALGGYVANTSLQGGENQARSATLELKLPAARFDEAVSGLHPIGEVEAVDIAAQDVGEEFVDVRARVANATRLETRLVDLLARRTGKLEDVLAVERELARVREEIERYEGRLRYLRTHTAVSTLLVTVHEPPPLLATQPGVNPIAEAFRDAWRNFVTLTAGVIASLGVVVPIGAVAGVAWAVWRRSRVGRVA